MSSHDRHHTPTAQRCAEDGLAIVGRVRRPGTVDRSTLDRLAAERIGLPYVPGQPVAVAASVPLVDVLAHVGLLVDADVLLFDIAATCRPAVRVADVVADAELVTVSLGCVATRAADPTARVGVHGLALAGDGPEVSPRRAHGRPVHGIEALRFQDFVGTGA